MRLLILSDLDSRNTRIGKMGNNSRLAGPLWICELSRKHGVIADTIDYFRSWDRSLLVSSILKFFRDDDEIYLAASGSVDDSNTIYFKEICEEIRQTKPNLKVILGGYRVITGNADWVDVSFIGRCSNLFEDYLAGRDISQFKISDNPVTYKNPHNVILETPVTPTVSGLEFASENEMLTIELGLGCKFNCAFCGFDYRNNKKAVLTTVDNIVKACQTAHDKYGITDFYLADDTINEVDDKLELLVEANKKLSFQPNFMAFARLDIIGAKPHQIDLLKRANINTMFFGIESLNPTVTKSIRKGGNPERNYETLRMLKRDYPEAFTYGNFIAGLTGDSEQDIFDGTNRIIDEQLLTSAGINPLRIYSRIDNPDSQSEIDKNPHKYGYEILDGGEFAGQYGYDADYWKNEWCDNTNAQRISDEIDRLFVKGLRSVYTAHEYASIKAILPGHTVEDYNSLLSFANQTQKMLVSRYIKEKSFNL
jgi:hypothetical protein